MHFCSYSGMLQRSFFVLRSQVPALLPRAKCCRYDTIVARWKLQSLAHLTQVDVLVRLAHRLAPAHNLRGHLTLARRQLVHSEPDRVLRLPLLHLLSQRDDHRASVLIVPRVGVREAEHKLGILDEVGHVVVATTTSCSASPLAMEVEHLVLHLRPLVFNHAGGGEMDDLHLAK